MTAIERGSDWRAAAVGAGLRLEHRSVESLIPYARNARTHSEEQVGRIAASIREFGFANPILIDGSNGSSRATVGSWPPASSASTRFR